MEVNEKKKEISREDRIRSEIDRIAVFYAAMDANQKALIIPLIQNAAFMRVTLDDLQEEIEKNGVVEKYQNGQNQFGYKQSSALQSYNSLIKNYAAVNKTLSMMMPREDKPLLHISTVIRGQTVYHWQQQMKKEAESDPEIVLMTFDEWLKRKLKQMDDEEAGGEKNE